MLEEAIRIMGHSHLGPPEFMEGLEVLLASAKSESKLTAVGKLSLRHGIINHLCSRLALYGYLQKHPDLIKSEIISPIFIVGLPRTGSTFLFHLLSQDLNHRAPLAWEFNLAPHPPHRTVQTTSTELSGPSTILQLSSQGLKILVLCTRSKLKHRRSVFWALL